ncbi:MAG TPA: hypothetical protein VGC91_14370, partial [Pyrinomonadaceae bacterium]
MSELSVPAQHFSSRGDEDTQEQERSWRARLRALSPLLSEEEQERLLAQFNQTDSDFGTQATACLHQLFEAQAQLRPEAVALSFAGAQV